MFTYLTPEGVWLWYMYLLQISEAYTYLLSGNFHVFTFLWILIEVIQKIMVCKLTSGLLVLLDNHSCLIRIAVWIFKAVNLWCYMHSMLKWPWMFCICYAFELSVSWLMSCSQVINLPVIVVLVIRSCFIWFFRGIHTRQFRLCGGMWQVICTLQKVSCVSKQAS